MNVPKVCHSVPEEIGNTVISSSTECNKNAKYKYIFVLNNYDLNDIEIIKLWCAKNCKKARFQCEIGENNTPHIQGCFNLKTKKRITGLKKESYTFSRCHFEVMNNEVASYDYCMKSDSSVPNSMWDFGFPKPLKVISTLLPFQQSIVNMIETEPDDRTINWIYDPIGCAGKTVLCKYLIKNYNVICMTGGAVKDIACVLKLNIDAGRDLNEKTTFILNLPRLSNPSYKGIEAVKDGLITSVKYESTTLCFNSPHLFVFSNELPDKDKLSADRWNIYTIKENELVAFVESPHLL